MLDSLTAATALHGDRIRLMDSSQEYSSHMARTFLEDAHLKHISSVCHWSEITPLRPLLVNQNIKSEGPRQIPVHFRGGHTSNIL